MIKKRNVIKSFRYVGNEDLKLEVVRCGDYLKVVEVTEEYEWVDITGECRASLKESNTTSGAYVAVTYKGVRLFASALNDRNMVVSSNPEVENEKLKIEPAQDSTVSCRVFMREDLYMLWQTDPPKW